MCSGCESHLGIVSNDLMLSCTGEASGLDVVLSGFFSSTAIYPNHLVEPEHRSVANAALAELGFHIWRIARFRRCRRAKRAAC